MFFGFRERLVLMREVARLPPLVVVVWLPVLMRVENLLRLLLLLLLELVHRVEIRINGVLRAMSRAPLSLA
jgi:hypothetical protein